MFVNKRLCSLFRERFKRNFKALTCLLPSVTGAGGELNTSFGVGAAGRSGQSPRAPAAPLAGERRVAGTAVPTALSHPQSGRGTVHPSPPQRRHGNDSSCYRSPACPHSRAGAAEGRRAGKRLTLALHPCYPSAGRPEGRESPSLPASQSRPPPGPAPPPSPGRSAAGGRHCEGGDNGDSEQRGGAAEPSPRRLRSTAAGSPSPPRPARRFCPPPPAQRRC